jgi:hypothetical protein
VAVELAGHGARAEASVARTEAGDLLVTVMSDGLPPATRWTAAR